MMGVLAVLAGMLGLFACGSSKQQVNNPGTQVVEPDALGSASLARLPLSPGAAGTIVKGTLKVRDFTVLDNGSGKPGPSIPATGIFVRVIDPGDDILVAGNPLTNGSYELFVPGNPLLARLEVELRVLEDLDGDGEGEDTLKQSIPLFLAEGRVHTVSLNLGRSTALSLDPNLEPETGAVVIASIDKLDAGGHVASEIAQFQNSGNLISDFDRDGFIEPGDDVVFVDANNDGTADPLATPPEAGSGNAIIQTILGTVVSVSETRGQISVRTNDNTFVDVSVSYFTPVESFVLSADGGGFFTVGISELSRNEVSITGYFSGGLFNALSVNTF
jgi:hypothetical protein